jgi:kynurenine formamidase
MALVDLTLCIPDEEQETLAPDEPFSARRTMRTREWRLSSGALSYAARVHYFEHWSMAGTYLDLPGHIVETDDGVDARTAPPERFYRLDAAVVRLDRGWRPGRITADELAAACPPAAFPARAMIVHALGPRRFDQIEARSVYLGRDAVAWIVRSGISLLVADVYESDTDPQHVFPDLFRAGIYVVCHPVNLDRLNGPRVKLTALPLRVAGATQLPCRVIAEPEAGG